MYKQNVSSHIRRIAVLVLLCILCAAWSRSALRTANQPPAEVKDTIVAAWELLLERRAAL